MIAAYWLSARASASPSSPLWNPYGGGWGWTAGVGSRHVGGETRGLVAWERETRCLLPIPLSPRHSCVCLYEDLSNSLSPSLNRTTTPLLLASSPSISLLSLARLRSSFPQLLSPAGVADLGVMTYRVSSARRSQTPFLWPPLCLPRSFHLSSVNFFPGLFGWPGRAAVSRCLG